ncbi:MAG: acylneuraminate cytidylyltransferase [Parcubacteria group bacterium Gr01-1014_56]|nr:MAG: acylneuraminate cytidylyltransferase [Parcubacteria group bacterium Gr01-1014_56]
MATIAIIQARMSSTRLPGKILLDIAPGKTILALMLERVAASKEIDKTVIATTTNPKDQVLVEYLEKTGQPYFVGSEEDVLDRYYQAAKAHGAKAGDIIVRMTSDCPIIDPKVIDETIRFYKSGDFDYASNNLEPYTYPDGMDTEVFSFNTLEKTWKEATIPAHREHVTFYMWKNPSIFKIGQYINPTKDKAGYRLTIDYKEDFELLQAVYTALYPKNNLFTMKEITDFLDANPAIKNLNTEVVRNASWKAA